MKSLKRVLFLTSEMSCGELIPPFWNLIPIFWRLRLRSDSIVEEHFGLAAFAKQIKAVFSSFAKEERLRFHKGKPIQQEKIVEHFATPEYLRLLYD